MIIKIEKFNLIKDFSKKKLEEAKRNNRALILDFDGTTHDSEYNFDKAILLIERIVNNGKLLSIITARGASGLRSLQKLLVKISCNTPIYLACGNGTILYKIFKKKIKIIYNNGLKFLEIKKIISIWEETYKDFNIKDTDLNPDGVSIFSQFILENWKGFIPDKIINLCKKYNGNCFSEEAKVSIVLPKNIDIHKKIIDMLQKKINKISKKKFHIVKGNDIYCHITRFFDVDPKLYALQTIMKDLRLKPEEVFVCGDMPLDNDKGLLIDSHLPFTFTNKLIPNWNENKPPFVLPGSEKLPVGSVHKAVDYLLS